MSVIVNLSCFLSLSRQARSCSGLRASEREESFKIQEVYLPFAQKLVESAVNKTSDKVVGIGEAGILKNLKKRAV